METPESKLKSETDSLLQEIMETYNNLGMGFEYSLLFPMLKEYVVSESFTKQTELFKRNILNEYEELTGLLCNISGYAERNASQLQKVWNKN